MAKEQRRGSRETKKPKQKKPKVIAAAPSRFADIPSSAKVGGSSQANWDQAFRAEHASIVLQNGRCIKVDVSDPRGGPTAEVQVRGGFPI